MHINLSVWSAYYGDLSPEDAVRELKRHGILYSELSDEHGLTLLKRGNPLQVGGEFKRFLEQEGFSMPQGHLWLKCQICSSETTVYELIDWIDLYQAIGIRNGVLHLDAIEEEEDLTEKERFHRNIEKLKILQKHIKDKGYDFCICLENLRNFSTKADQLNYVLDQLDPDCFGICLDTGHLNLTEKNQREFILKAGKRLKALHIADNEGQYDQHMMPFGRGNVNFDEVVKALREIDYEGLFNYEIPGERMAPQEVLGYKLEYIQKCFAYLLKRE